MNQHRPSGTFDTIKINSLLSLKQFGQYLSFLDFIINLFDLLKGHLYHFLLPIGFLILSHFNEKFYLQPDCDTYLPLYFIKVVLFVFGFWLSNVIQNTFSKIQTMRKEYGKIILTTRQKSFIILMSWFLIWYGFWLIIYYPGSYTPDTLDAIRQISYMKINDWFSFLHPLTYLFLYQFYPDIISIGIAQIFLCSVVFADIISFSYAHFKIRNDLKLLLFGCFVIFISTISSVVYYNFFYMRDIPSSIIHLYFAFYIFKICMETGKSPLTRHQAISLLGIGLFLSLYRGEGWIIMLVALVSLFFYGKVSLKSFSKLFLFFCVSLFLLNNSLPNLLKVHFTSKEEYNLTLVAYPLGFILREGKNYISSDYEKDKEILSKVIDIEGIQKHTNSYEITAFQHEGNYWKRDASKEDWQEFYKRTLKIFVENPHLFLAARTANFMSQLFIFDKRAEKTNDTGRFDLTAEECIKHKQENKWCNLYCDDIMLGILKMLPQCDSSKEACGYSPLMIIEKFNFQWHWNSLFALLASIFVLCLYKYLPVSAVAASIILSRIPLVFLTAPYAFFRYVYSLYLFGLFILLFVILEVYEKKLSKLQQTNL
jgi:hypothetical protein